MKMFTEAAGKRCLTNRKKTTATNVRIDLLLSLLQNLASFNSPHGISTTRSKSAILTACPLTHNALPPKHPHQLCPLSRHRFSLQKQRNHRKIIALLLSHHCSAPDFDNAPMMCKHEIPKQIPLDIHSLHHYHMPTLPFITKGPFWIVVHLAHVLLAEIQVPFRQLYLLQSPFPSECNATREREQVQAQKILSMLRAQKAKCLATHFKLRTTTAISRLTNLTIYTSIYLIHAENRGESFGAPIIRRTRWLRRATS